LTPPEDHGAKNISPLRLDGQADAHFFPMELSTKKANVHVDFTIRELNRDGLLFVSWQDGKGRTVANEKMSGMFA
jgi:hypothetical protein